MNEMTAQTLLDRAAISDVFHRYALGADTRDWELFRRCFTDDVEVDFTSLWPGAVFHGADVWVAKARDVVNALDATQHIITNHTHDIQGDTATCTAYLHAQHVFKNDVGGDQLILGGYYRYEMVRSSDGWKIRKYSLTVTWTNGNSALFDLADEKMKDQAAG